MNHGTPLVSVIMPLYNKRPYVRRAIESVREQTHQRWELIVVDDGSTDGSADAVPCDDTRIRLLRQDNKGPGAARNQAFRASTGDLIAFIDADDCYLPCKLETEVRSLCAENTARWMISAFEQDIAGSRLIKRIRDCDGSDIVGEPRVFHDAFAQLTVAGWHVDGLCLRRQVFEDVGGFDETMRCYEITDFAVRCSLSEPRVLVYPGILYRVIHVPNSAFQVYAHQREGLRQLGDSIWHLSRTHPEHSATLAARSRESFYSYAATLILAGHRRQARSFLRHTFPCPRDKRWWTFLAGSLLPSSVIRLALRRSSGVGAQP